MKKPTKSPGKPGVRSTSKYRGVTHHCRTGRFESHIWDSGKQVSTCGAAPLLQVWWQILCISLWEAQSQLSMLARSYQGFSECIRLAYTTFLARCIIIVKLFVHLILCLWSLPAADCVPL